MLEIDLSGGQVSLRWKIHQNINVVVLVRLSFIEIELGVDEEDLFELEKINNNMAALEKIFAYTFEVITSFATSVLFQILQMLVQLPLNSQKHPMRKTVIDCLELRNQVSVLLPQRRTLNRLFVLLLLRSGFLGGEQVDFFIDFMDLLRGGLALMVLLRIEVDYFSGGLKLFNIFQLLMASFWGFLGQR